MSNTHVYSARGSKDIKANITGRGLVSPTEKTASLAIYEMVDVPSLSMSGSLTDVEAGVIQDIPFPDSWLDRPQAELSGSRATLSLQGTCNLEFDGVFWKRASGSVFVGYGTQRQFHDYGDFVTGIWAHVFFGHSLRNEYDEGLGRKRYWATPYITFYPYTGGDQGQGVKREFEEQELSYSEGKWTLSFDYPLSEFTFGFDGVQVEPDFYYHQCTGKKFVWEERPSGFEFIGTPVEDIDVAHRCWSNYVEQVYVYVQTSEHDGGTWTVGWEVSFPSWHYYH